MKATWIEGYYVYLDDIAGVEKSDKYSDDKKDWVATLLVTQHPQKDVKRIKLRELCIKDLDDHIVYLRSIKWKGEQ